MSKNVPHLKNRARTLAQPRKDKTSRVGNIFPAPGKDAILQTFEISGTTEQLCKQPCT
jgi:hypothetical protein